MDFNQWAWTSVRNLLIEASVARRERGGRCREFAMPTCAELLEHRELPAAASVGFTIPANPDPLRSQGTQSMLVVRVTLDGQNPSDFVGDYDIRNAYSQVNDFYTRQSFGKLTFPRDQLTVVSATVDLPLQINKLEKSSNGPVQITKATETALTKLGYNLKNYLHLTILHPMLSGKAFDYSGLGLMPGNRVLLNGEIDPEVWAHELGHNAGAPHAGIFSPKDPNLSVADPKLMKFSESSTGLDVMDAEGLVGIDHGGDMFALRKAEFGWLDVKNQVTNVTSTGTYHLTAIDEGTEPGNPTYALR